jgi:hypothetical protein
VKNSQNSLRLPMPEWDMVMIMVLNATFNNSSVISWRSVLLVEETRVPEENHRLAASHWQSLSHNVVSSTPRHLTTVVMIGTDCTGSCKSNYNTITYSFSKRLSIYKKSYINIHFVYPHNEHPFMILFD